MLNKTVKIDGIDVNIACSAGTPRRYRMEFGKDLFKDIQSVSGNNINTEVIENLIYIMAKEADKDIAPIDEWLEQFGPMSIIEAAPDIISFWANNTQSASTSKKK